MKQQAVNRISPDFDTETVLRLRVISLSSLLAAGLCLFFSVLSVLHGDISIAVVLGSITVAGLMNVLYIRLKKDLRTGAMIASLTGFFLGLYLFLHLGTYNFAFVWVYTLPPFFLFIMGLKRGLTVALAFLGVSVLSIVLPDNSLVTADYPGTFLLRFAASFGSITLISALYEYSRAKSQQTIHVNERRFRSLIENSVSVYAIIELDGTIRYESPSLKTVYGYEPAELVGANILGQVHPDDREAAMGELQDLVQNPGKVKTIETRYQHKNGSWRQIEVSGICLLNDPAIQGIVLSSHDITEQKRAEKDLRKLNETLERRIEERGEQLRKSEEQLRHSQKMRAIGRLAGGIAHDFNNQLSGILGCADLLRSTYKTDDSQYELADTIVKAAKRAGQFNDQLLAFARKGKYQSTPISIHAVIGDVVSLLEHSIDKKITIKHDRKVDEAVVKGDPSQLQNMLLNLALNARDAMPEGGELIFATALTALDVPFCEQNPFDIEPGPFISVTVSDTGVGMDSTTRERIFEPFFTTKENGAGAGMGLAAVYGTVQNHGGTIEVTSRPGKGSSICIYLPEAPATEEPRETRTDVKIDESGPRLTILVVDDEESVRFSVKRLLEDKGHRVISCRDGTEAITIYAAQWQDIDCVVLDLVMPKMNGTETFHRMQEINPKLKVLISSGYSLNRNAQKLIDQGAMAFVQKPYDQKELLAKVAETATAQ